METKYYIINDDNFEKVLPEFGIRIEPNGRTEIVRDFAVILSKQFEIRMITIEQGEEISNVSYRDFLEGSKQKKAEAQEAKVSKKSR